MKKVLVTICFIGFIGLAKFSVLAATSTPAAIATSSADAKAQELLDRVSTKVAEIAKDYQRPYSGTITTINSDNLVINTPDGTRTVLVSEITDYYRVKSGAHSAIDLKNLTKGDDISALGTIDPTTDNLTAKQVIVKTKRLNVSGKVTSADSKKGYFTIQAYAITPTATDSGQITVDVDLTTPIKKVLSTSGIIKGKYGDLKNASYLWVIGYYDPTDKPYLTPLKILVQ